MQLRYPILFILFTLSGVTGHALYIRQTVEPCRGVVLKQMQADKAFYNALQAGTGERKPTSFDDVLRNYKN